MINGRVNNVVQSVRRWLQIFVFGLLVVCCGVAVVSSLRIEYEDGGFSILRDEMHFHAGILGLCLLLVLVYLPLVHYARVFDLRWQNALLMPIFRFNRLWLNLLHLPLSVACGVTTCLCVPWMTFESFPLREGVWMSGEELFGFTCVGLALVAIYSLYTIIYLVRKSTIR